MFQIKSNLSSKYKNSLVCLAFGIIISSCVSSSVIDRSFVTQDPCAAPCWQELTPGQSTLVDVRNVLENLAFVDQTTIVEKKAYWLNDENALIISYDCKYDSPLTSGCGGLIIDRGKLSSTWIYIAYDLKFSDVAIQLGNPDYVSYFMQPTGCEITLIWAKKAVSATSYQKSECPNQGDPKDNGMTVTLS